MALFTKTEMLPIGTHLAQMSPGEAAEFIRRQHNIEPTPERVAELEAAASLTRRVMLGILDGVVDGSDIDAINAIRQEYPSIPFLQIENGVIVPAYLLAENDLDGMFQMIGDELFNLCLNPQRVRRCEECGNPYLIVRDRGNNRFCSKRCNDRVASRNKRRRQKTAPVITDTCKT